MIYSGEFHALLDMDMAWCPSEALKLTYFVFLNNNKQQESIFPPYWFQVFVVCGWTE